MGYNHINTLDGVRLFLSSGIADSIKAQNDHQNEILGFVHLQVLSIVSAVSVYLFCKGHKDISLLTIGLMIHTILPCPYCVIEMTGEYYCIHTVN